MRIFSDPGCAVSIEECLATLHTAEAIIGDSPSESDYKKLGLSPRIITYRKKFGSWNLAKTAANLRLLDQYHKTRAKHVNVDYFTEIDTAEKAYWLGLLYGDASMQENEYGTLALAIHLKAADRDQIDLFVEAIESEHTVGKYVNGSVGVTIGVQKFLRPLVEHGLTPDKTNSDSLPDLSDDLKPHFIRGLHAADGHTSSYRMDITGYKPRLERLAGWFPDEIEVSVKENNGRGRLVVSRAENLKNLIKWLYPDGEMTFPQMHRKRPLVSTE